MYRRIAACLLAICVLIAAVPMPVSAAAQQQVTAEHVTVAPGNTVRVAIKAESFDVVATLEVGVYYDSSVLTLTNANTGSLLSGSSSQINKNTPGEVKLVTMNVQGISGDGTLMTLQFQASGDAMPGACPITVVVGNAWDTALKPVTIGSQNGSVEITEPVETETFSIYGYFSQTHLQKGDVLSYRIANSGRRPFVSGDFLITYDHELFALESVQLESGLLTGDAMYSVNSSALGQVRITYAKTTPVQEYYLLTVKLKVIADRDTTTTVTAQASNMYRENLSPYLPGTTSGTLTLQKLPEVTDYPNAFLQTGELIVGSQSKSTFYLEKGANVGAADFLLTYDPTVLRCVSVTASESVAVNGGMVIINDDFADGSIRFSYVNMEAYDDVDLPLIEITWQPLQSPSAHYQVIVSSEDVVDPQQTPLQLEQITDTGCIYAISVVPPGCTEEGYTAYTCHDCGDGHKEAFVDSVGHTGGEATCVSGKICDNCHNPYGEVDPEAHAYDSDRDNQCNLCGEYRTLTILLGDLNLDGEVNSDDLTLLARHVGGIALATGEALANADVNGDGAVNSDDLTLHARYVGGIITDWNQK